MRANLLLALILSVCSTAPARADWVSALGLGADLRLTRGANTSFAVPHLSAQVFALLAVDRLAFVPEVTTYGSNSGEGALSVRTRTWATALWERYHFVPLGFWSPFAGVGEGIFIDRVNTTYPGMSDVRYGRRAFLGLGVGVNRIFWEWLLVESELRAESIQNQRGPDYDFVFRAAYRF